MAAAALQIFALSKTFRGKRAVDGVNLSVERGEIVGFLGPNGAGKSTVMNIVAGLLRPDRGHIELLGIPGGAQHRSVRLRIGYLQERPRIYPEMSARAYLRFFARLYGVPESARRVAATLERVGLAVSADRPLGTYSRGMQQRACLARVMLHEPEFLMLDEPTLGLDPPGVVEMRDIFREMREAGTTLFFSSHQLAEMERICDSVAFMHNGRLVASGPPATLLVSRGSPDAVYVDLHEPVAPVIPAMRGLALVAAAREAGLHRAEVELKPDGKGTARDSRAALVRELTGLGLTVLGVSDARRSLEDFFLAITEQSPASQAEA